ncbi:MAG: MoxR family ATPase [Verrucomicrobiales bacterium]|nr:MoxR family ATPase [Verrucomicrobiales bacterium]
MSDQAALAAEVFKKLAANIGLVLRGQEVATRRLLAAFAAGGHVLLDDFPGTGKTTLAKTLALSLDARFNRIQFTPDLLPTDIVGVSVFNQREQSFDFREGPVFTEVLLADEINRASPRTQSALLEAMAEGQVSVEGQRRPLSDLFFVIATQNPIEFRGTYPLPEAQMDRFMMRFGLGYVSAAEEVAILTGQSLVHPLDFIRPCCTAEEVRRLRQAAKRVRISEELLHHIVALVRATREIPGVPLGASPRASLSLMKAAQALALFDGEEFVHPEHITELAPPVIGHRLVMDPQTRFSGATPEALVEDLLRRVPAPR